MPRTRFILAAGPALAALLVTGCGGGDGSSSTPSSPSSPASSTSSTTPSTPTLDPCGVLGGFSETPHGIVNGIGCSSQQADRSSVVSLQLLGGDGEAQSFCSGTVIDTKAVLTAAHCLGSTTKGVAFYQGGGRVPIKAVEFHASPDYTGTGPSSLDVGVVIFGESLERTPIPLLTSRTVNGGESAIVAGWGTDGITGPSSALRAGTTTVTRVTQTQIEVAFSTTSSGVCTGDSGGPLLVSQGGAWAVAGVTSAVTLGCLSGTSFYANVYNSSVRSFILKYVPGAVER
jgi:hypothetical protein